MKKTIISSIFLVLFSVSNIYCDSLSTLITKIRSRTDDPSTNTVKQRRGDTVITYIINEAQKKVCEDTWCLISSTHIALHNGTTYYNLPADYYVATRVVFNSTTILAETTIDKLDRDDTSWLSYSTGTPEAYYTNAENTKIGTYPRNSGGSIDMWYVKYATDLSSGSDVPFNGVSKYYPYHELIKWYAIAMILLEEGSQNASVYYNMYAAGVASMANNIKVKPNFTPSIIFKQ